jgi:hypothetical protein
MRHPQFQFSLKTLLWLMLGACLTLGAWHWLIAFEYVAAEPTKVGESIKVRGRYFSLFDNESETYQVLSTASHQS